MDFEGPVIEVNITSERRGTKIGAFQAAEAPMHRGCH